MGMQRNTFDIRFKYCSEFYHVERNFSNVENPSTVPKRKGQDRRCNSRTNSCDFTKVSGVYSTASAHVFVPNNGKEDKEDCRVRSNKEEKSNRIAMGKGMLSVCGVKQQVVLLFLIEIILIVLIGTLTTYGPEANANLLKNHADTIN
ncbi:ammonium transporter Rh type A isoform X1 [Vespula maculifrons]|uniref:Ammonium transporter Rh type A isoform X1 n=1 Tax=Vespula maculifrons TaxID=7453 RepID=A0ABD2CVC8_VESMC